MVELGERVRAELRVVRATDPALFVDPDDRRYVDNVVELGNPVFGIDQTGVLGLGPFDEGPRIIRTPVERDRNRDEAFGAELFVQCLPDRQVLTAASPRRIGNQQYLLAAVLREAVDLPAQIRQLEVRSFEGR